MYSKGPGISNVDTAFGELNIPAIIYDQLFSLIYRHDPQNSMYNVKPFHAMVRRHKETEQTGARMVESTTDYHLNEKEEPPEHKMLKYADDLLKHVEPLKTNDKTVVSKHNIT